MSSLVDPKQILVDLESEKQKKNKTKTKKQKTKNKKKRSSPHFALLILYITLPPSIFNFSPSLLQFPSFFSQFSPLSPFFPCLFFPGRSAESSSSEVSSSEGTLPPPPPVTPLLKAPLHGQPYRHTLRNQHYRVEVFSGSGPIS